MFSYLKMNNCNLTTSVMSNLTHCHFQTSINFYLKALYLIYFFFTTSSETSVALLQFVEYAVVYEKHCPCCFVNVSVLTLKSDHDGCEMCS